MFNGRTRVRRYLSSSCVVIEPLTYYIIRQTFALYLSFKINKMALRLSLLSQNTLCVRNTTRYIGLVLYRGVRRKRITQQVSPTADDGHTMIRNVGGGGLWRWVDVVWNSLPLHDAVIENRVKGMISINVKIKT